MVFPERPAQAAVMKLILQSPDSAVSHTSEVLVYPLSHLYFCYFCLEPGLDRKLEFLLEPVSLTKVLGATALLPCVVTGYPPPHVRWMLGDKVLEDRYEPSQLLGRVCPASVLRASSRVAAPNVEACPLWASTQPLPAAVLTEGFLLQKTKDLSTDFSVFRVQSGTRDEVAV